MERLFENVEASIGSWLCPDGIKPNRRGAREYWMAWFITMQYLRTPLSAKITKHKAAQGLHTVVRQMT
jgi:hypothetical protein